MDFFFVLSAFLLTERLLLRELTPRTTLRFYVRRAQRIWPLYFAGVLAIFLINEVAHWLAPGWAAARDSLPQFLTFTQYVEMYSSPGDAFHSRFPDYVPYAQHLWSLAVEEQFYLLLPFTVAGFAFFQRTFPAAQYFAVAALLLLPLAARLMGFHFFLLIHHLDAFILGYVFARLNHSAGQGKLQREPMRRALGWLAIVALAGAIPYLYQGYLDCQSGIAHCGSTPTNTLRALTTTAFNLLWFSLVGLVCLHTGSNRLRWLRPHWLVLTGRMSYSLYIIHVPLLFWTVPALAQTYGFDRYTAGLLCVPLILAVAYLTYRVFDARFQNIGPAPRTS